MFLIPLRSLHIAKLLKVNSIVPNIKVTLRLLI